MGTIAKHFCACQLEACDQAGRVAMVGAKVRLRFAKKDFGFQICVRSDRGHRCGHRSPLTLSAAGSVANGVSKEATLSTALR